MVNYKLKAARVERNKDQLYMAKLLDVALQTYSKKECGKTKFTIDEVEAIVTDFELSGEQIKDIFFTNQLNTKGKMP